MWLMLTIALLPVVFALVVPMLPELVQRIERIKFGSFEASMASDRIAAGTASAIISERSSQEFDFDLEAWANYEERRARNRFIEEFFTGNTSSEDNFAVVHDALIGPLSQLLQCQRVAGVGHPENIILLDRMILILSDRKVFDGVLKTAARREDAGLPWSFAPGPPARVVIDETIAAVDRIEGLLKLTGHLQTHAFAPGREASETASDPCGAIALRDGLRRVHLTGDPVGRVEGAFQDGHLSAFVATLIIVRGAGTDAALTRASRELWLVTERNAIDFENGQAGLSPIEVFNVRWILGRAMLRARWDVEAVHAQLDGARVAVYCMMKAMRTERADDDVSNSPCQGWRTKKQANSDSNAYAIALGESFRPLVLTDMLMLAHQYSLEGLMVPPETADRARKASEALAKFADEWSGFSDHADPTTNRRNRILANAIASVQMFSIVNANDENILDEPTCRRAGRRMERVLKFWEDEEEVSRLRGEIGSHALPWMLAQKYTKYIKATCKAVED